MSTREHESAEVDDLLRLTACPHCDYSLESLGPEGTCPECGAHYDQRFIVLTGRGRGRFDTPAGGTWRGVLGHASSVLLLLWLFVGSGSGFRHPLLVSVGVGGALALAAGAYVLLFSAREPRQQLWLSPDGFAQVSSTSEGSQAQRLIDLTTPLLLPFVFGVYLLSWRRAYSISALIVLSIVAICVGKVVRDELRRRRAAAEGHGSGPAELIPWARMLGGEIKMLSHDRMRIRMQTTRKWGRIELPSDSVVDIEVEGTHAKADRVQALVTEWRGPDSMRAIRS